MEPGADNRASLDELVPRLYDELRRLARGCMRGERAGHTLRPTALVHEAYLRLLDQRQADWGNRAQLLGLAAQMMRRVLLNHARDRGAAKRGGRRQRVTLDESAGPALFPREVDLVALDAALDRLAAADARKARVIELKFFGGLTSQEIAELLHVSTATVEREWAFARAWLFEAMAGASA